MRHFDVQLLGGLFLHYNYVAEMRTGEGKTLTSTLPAYLNALLDKGVHIVTMNEYLAKRDAQKNKYLFEFLGLSVGINLSKMSREEKKKSYLSDITYGTNYEYGFDYLRDNMVLSNSQKVQRSLYYALIDEVDSILIDEARTPLIISGSIENTSNLYEKINKLVPFFNQKNDLKISHQIKDADFYVDYKKRQLYLTEKGIKKTEFLLRKHFFFKKNESLYVPKNIIFIQHVMLALKAHYLFFQDKDYIIKNSKIIIIDEHSGRMSFGRRWSEGIHQAIEAKENLLVQPENQTLAAITFQNYFRLYKKLSGMTGTAVTESFEFFSIYNLNTIVIPTNKPMIRTDLPDLVYISEVEKHKAIILAIKDCYKRKQPILVGTISIKKSEIISKILKKNNIKHNILNAKFPFREAKIIENAGKPGAVTIATNMAGRGTDIILGGYLNQEIHDISVFLKNNKKNHFNKKKWIYDNKLVIKLGGLHVLGTERHESRRIDNQLRGRSGRQGDPGSSQFYLSLEDSLMRFFSSDILLKIIKILGNTSNQVIQHPWINYAIENAQKKIENQNFDIRRQLLEYDDIINEQRKLIYFERNKILDSKNTNKYILFILQECIDLFLEKNKIFIFQNKIDFLEKKFKKIFFISSNLKFLYQRYPNLFLDIQSLSKEVNIYIQEKYHSISVNLSSKNIFMIEKSIILQSLDFCWREYLNSIDSLKNSIYLRGYAQKDPKQEYQRDIFFMFQKLLQSIRSLIIHRLFKFFFINFSYKKNILLDLLVTKNYDYFNFFVFHA